MHTNRRQVLAALALVPGMALAASSLAESGSDQEHDEIEQTDLAAKNAAIIRRQNALMNSGDYSAAAQFGAEDADNFGRPVGRKGNGATAFTLAIEVVKTTELPSGMSGTSFWAMKYGPFAFRLSISS